MTGLFRRETTLDADLGRFSLEDALFALHTKSTASVDDFYVAERYDNNHFLIDVKKSRVYSGGKHDFRYLPESRQLRLSSGYYASAYRVYLYLVLPLIPFLHGDFKNWDKMLGIFVLLALGITAILASGIRDESKRIEMEVVHRISYLLRYGKR